MAFRSCIERIKAMPLHHSLIAWLQVTSTNNRAGIAFSQRAATRPAPFALQVSQAAATALYESSSAGTCTLHWPSVPGGYTEASSAKEPVPSYLAICIIQAGDLDPFWLQQNNNYSTNSLPQLNLGCRSVCHYAWACWAFIQARLCKACRHSEVLSQEPWNDTVIPEPSYKRRVVDLSYKR